MSMADGPIAEVDVERTANMTEIRDFNIDIPKTALDDLDIRLRHVRWPDPEPVDDWSQGIPLEYVKTIVDHWRTS